MVDQRRYRLKNAEMVSYKAARKTKDFVLGIFVAVLLIGVVYTILAPVIGIISLSFMSVEDVFNPTVFVVPISPSLMNIRYAIRFMDYWTVLARTLVYSLGMGLLHVLVASFVGYGFARYRFWGNKFFFGLVLFTIIIPVQAYMAPLFMHFRFFGPTDINLLNSFASIIILTSVGMGLRSGLFIYIFRQFFRGLPVEISEAAFIDGAGPMRTYATVIMPNAMPAIITVLMLALVWHYGDTFYSGILLGNTRFVHVAVGGIFAAFMVYRGNLPTDINQMEAQMAAFAGVVLVIAPILLIYSVLQRRFIEGIERSGIVG